jgi:hypothetical protein
MWIFVRMTVLALLLLTMPLAQAQDTSVAIRAWSYIFPDGDACVQLEWEANGLAGHELQMVMRGIDTNGDFLPNEVSPPTEFADRTGLLTSRLNIVVPFEETEWTDTYICLPAGQFPLGEYDWYPVITILDRTVGGVLLLMHIDDPISFGQFGGSPGQLVAPQSTPEVSP